MWKCYFLLLFFLKIEFDWQEGLFQTPIRFFFGKSVLYFSYLSSICIDTIENHAHFLYIIVDRNQEFIFV